MIYVKGYVEVRNKGLNKAFGNGVLDEIRGIFNTEFMGEVAAMGLNGADT